MNRLLLFIFTAAVLLGVWQRSRLIHLQERQTLLALQLNAAQRTPAVSGAPSVVPVGGERALDDGHGRPSSTPLKVEEFFELAGELSTMESKLGAGTNRREYRDKILTLFSRLAATPVDQLKAIMDQLPSSPVSADGKQQISTAIMNLLAQSDPASATSYALQYQAPGTTLQVALRRWAKEDATAAAAWVAQAEASGTLPPSLKASQLHLILLPHQIAADPAGFAVEQIAQLPPADLSDFFAETTLLLTTDDQRRALLKQLTTLPELPPGALGHFLQQVGRTASVETATNLLKEAGASLSPARFDETAVLAVTARIDANTPKHADWLLQNLRSPGRQPAITRLMENWTHADFNAAATWLKDQPGSPDHDIAVAAFAPLVAAKEPPSAIDWAVTIADPDRRSALLSALYQDWSSKAPAEAEAYFRVKNLTPPLP
jgi:hypothetical protein